ncbi:MAG TPA: GWxTD domain-containing protein [Acidobacteriota bacterium]|nr:GWxTD domain-containing protein [Acidobacteriota bacterium]
MRRNQFASMAFIFLLVFALSTELVDAQRGRGGGGRGRAPAALEEAKILEEFDNIVDLIWTDREEDTWNDIDDDATEDKQAFITMFWENRDPTPGTESNEFREVWMQRVAYTQRYNSEGIDGWRTDRGKFYLIYGPEVLTVQSTQRATGGSSSGERQARASSNTVWELDDTQNPFLEGKKEVMFARYQRSYSRITGGIELNQEAFLAGVAVSNYFEARRANPSSAGPVGAGAVLAPGGAATASGVIPTPDILAMQQLMQNGVTLQDLVVRQEMAFIPAPEGNTYSIFNFDVGKSGLTFESLGSPGPANLLAFGVLRKKDPASANGLQFVYELKIPFAVVPSNGTAEVTSTHSFGMTIEPGDYLLSWGVMDIASEGIGTTDYELTVPDYAGEACVAPPEVVTGAEVVQVGPCIELAIPSVIMASSLEQMTDATDLNKVYSRTRVASLELETTIENEFNRNDSLLLLYFIKGLGVDPGTQQNRFELTHRILLAGTETSIARLPLQEKLASDILQEIPLSQVQQIEAGTDYEILIEINDQITGNVLFHKVPFSVRGS